MAEHSACSGCGNDDVGRRTFISQSALAAAAVVLAACTGDKPFLAGPAITGSIKVGDYPALANVNGAALVAIGETPLAVVRTGATSFVALSRVCPHQGGLIVGNGSAGWRCTGHGALFSLTGDWIGGQNTFSMTSFRTSYNATTDILTIG